MNTRWIGHPIYRMDEVDSTNEEAKRYLSQGVESGALFVAERQTAGKGRRGRSWDGRPGESLLMSAVLRLSLTPEQASGLTLVTGLAVCRAVESLPACPKAAGPRIKWPNDVILGSRKICGILVELLLERERNGIVIGIGVNVNNSGFPQELREKATSLKREWGRTVDREDLMERIWQEFEAACDCYLLTRDMRGLREEYEQRLINMGCPVRTESAGGGLEGIAEGIDDRGRLRIRKADGELVCIDAGEVSVRGIYGYV